MPVITPVHSLKEHLEREKSKALNGSETHAIILQFTHGGCVATRHEVLEQSGRKILGAGKGLGKAGIKGLLTKISATSTVKDVSIDVIPANVLVNTSSLLCWYTPPQLRTLWFLRDNKKVAIKNAPLPALVFTTDGKTLWIHALSDGNRPDKNTELFNAPFFNVHPNAAFCIGGADAPYTTYTSDIGRWESCLFDALFTHAHNKETFRAESQVTDAQHLKLWRGLASTGRMFNSELLASSGTTLGRFLQYVAS